MNDEVQQATGSGLIRPLPGFEGKVVDAIVVKMSGATALEGIDTVMSVDDRVLMLAEFTVVSIRHMVDEKTGNLIREQTLKPVMLTLQPWDSDNPADDGVLRRQGIGAQ